MNSYDIFFCQFKIMFLVPKRTLEKFKKEVIEDHVGK